MADARRELINLQKRWARELKARIYKATERNTPELDRYYNEYRRIFRRGYQRAATRDELVRQLGQADIAFFGDYHTLRIVQKTVALLLDETATRFDRKLILGLEMLRAGHQPFADRYLAGRLTEQEFLDAIDYSNTWGFDWPSYRALFDLARRRGFKLVGLNSEPGKDGDALHRRDQYAADLIAAASIMFPDHLVAVLFGDLHVGETHLPARTRAALAAKDVKRRDLIVYENSETFFWKLVEDGKEQVVDAVKLEQGVYCVMNATPLVKFQSWANWQESGGELEYTGLDSLGHEYRGPTDLSQQFQDIVNTIAGFLKVRPKGLDDFELYTTGDLDFLADLERRKVYRQDELEALKRHIAVRHSAFFPRARTLYLGNLSINNAADMAARFIHFNCAPESYDRRYPPKDGFYIDVLQETLGTLGAFILNPRYRVATFRDHESRLAGLRRRQQLNRADAQGRDISRFVLEHSRMVKKMIEHPRARNTLRAIYQLKGERYWGVTRALGALLAAELFHELSRNAVPVQALRDLFFRQWKKGEPFDAYVDLKRRLAQPPGEIRGLGGSL